MITDERLDFIFLIGHKICQSYTGFTKNEKEYCGKKMNWMWLSQFINAQGPCKILLLFKLSPVFTIVGCVQYILSSLINFPYNYEEINQRLQNIIDIIDNHEELESMIVNTKVIRALLAIISTYKNKDQFGIGHNACVVMAHIVKKHPCIINMNVNLTKGKNRKRRFTEKDVEKYF